MERLCKVSKLITSTTVFVLFLKFRDWVFGNDEGFVCQITPLLFYGLTATSLLNLLAVTMNR